MPSMSGGGIGVRLEVLGARADGQRPIRFHTCRGSAVWLSCSLHFTRLSRIGPSQPTR